jgi:hypothetical protein
MEVSGQLHASAALSLGKSPRYQLDVISKFRYVNMQIFKMMLNLEED